MNKFLIVFLVAFLIFSCRKKEEENKDIFGEAFFTDSFSPSQWENPVGRKKIEAVDKDIGKFIDENVIDPELRSILKLIENFVLYIQQGNNAEMEKIMTPSCFNSFSLRYARVDFDKNYTIRAAYPGILMNNLSTESSSIDKQNLTGEYKGEEKGKDENNGLKKITIKENEPFWIQFKILFEMTSITGKIELVLIEKEFKISDFDNQFYSDLTKSFTKEKSDVINNQ